LVNAAGARAIPTALGTRVESLIVKSGRVTGVRAGGTEVTGSSVVIGTGGFGNNFQMLQRLFPSVAAHGESWVWAVAHDATFIMGDGITIAEEIGAGVVGADTGLINLTTGLIGKNIEGYLPPWVILVNQEGRRFMAEYTPYNVSGPLLAQQTGQRAWAIFDHAALTEAGGNAKYLDPVHGGHSITTFDKVVIERSVREGRVKTADTVVDLAAKTGVDAISLQQTVSTYNADCEAGHDTVFLKKAQRLFPLKEPPFYAVEVRPSVVGFTAAGLDINVRGQVLDRHQKPIPGLYAGGEVLGCIHGSRYAGSGNSIASAIIWGRTAGAAAAADALAHRPNMIHEPNSQPQTPKARSKE
jgi:fumarate reductase flavoprotein subunit